MKNKGFRTFSIIAIVSILNSCSIFLQSPKALYVHSLSPIEQSTSQHIWSSDYYFYDSTGVMVHDKTINSITDSVLDGISFGLGYSEPSYNSFSASWYKVPPIENPVQTNRNRGIPLDVYVHDSRNNQLPKDESLNFNYYFADPILKFSYTFEHESSRGYVGLNEVTVSHESDSLSYERILEISPEIIEFFRQEIFKLGDSIELTTIPNLPDMSNCSLKESRYTFIESLSNRLGNKKETTIDSVLVDGKYEVQQYEDFYFLFEEMDSQGGYKFKRYTTNYYLEQHFLPNEVSPYYELRYYLSQKGIDTTLKTEMTVSKDGRFDCYKLVHEGHLSQKSGPRDLRLPIVKREMYFWMNPRKSKIVRKRYVAYTDQNHRLEKEWITSNDYKIITLIDTIPEVSGNQKYDVVPKDPHVPQYPYFNSLSTKKHKTSRKSQHHYNRDMIKNLRKHTIELENDRNSGYEKRISSDSLEMYEIYYFKKE